MTGIVFEELIDSPESVGTLLVTLPLLRALASQNADVLAPDLPRLEVALTGTVNEHAVGTLAGDLPALAALGLQAAGSSLILTLPPLATLLRDANTDTLPEDGALDFDLPALGVALVGSSHLVGALSFELPPLGLRALELAGNSLILDLPALRATGLQAIPELAVAGLGVQSAGLLWAYAPTTLQLDLEADFASAAELAQVRLIANVVEQLALSGEAASLGRFRQEAQAGLSFAAICQLVFTIVAEEAVVPTAIAEVTRRQIITAVEYLVATGVAESKLAGLEQVTAALAVSALATRGARLTAETEAAFNAELIHLQRHLVEALSELAFDDEAELTARFTIVAEAGFAAVAEASSLARLLVAVEAGFAVAASFAIGGERFAAWVINTESDAVSRYSNFDFNSLTAFDDRYFGLRDDGLYEFTGTTDDGTDIDWRLRTGLIDFGTPQAKGVPLMYLAYANDGAVYLKVAKVDGLGRKHVHWYAMGAQSAVTTRQEQCPIGKGLESVHYQFTLESIEGSRIDVDALRFVPLKTGRRS